MSDALETLQARIVESIRGRDGEAGAGSDAHVGRLDGEWLEIDGNLDVQHLASDLLADGYDQMRPELAVTTLEADALPHRAVIVDAAGRWFRTIKRMDGLNWFVEGFKPGRTNYIMESHALAYPVRVMQTPPDAIPDTPVRIVTTEDELAALPLGTVVRAHWADNHQRDSIVMRCAEGGASSSGYGVADTKHWLTMARWGAVLTVVSVPGVAL